MKTLVILPGWGGSHVTWQPFIDSARHDFNVVCIDLPCFGMEPCPQTVWGVEEYADFVIKKISDTGKPTSDIVLLGHSFGGQIAAYLVAKHPHVVGQLILSGPALFRAKRSLHSFVFGTIAKAGKWVFKLPFLERFDLWAKKLLYRAADSPDYNETTGIKREIFKRIVRQDLTEMLPLIAIPTTVIWGTHDTYVPVCNGKRAVQLIPHAKLRIVEGGGHGLHMKDPAGFLAILKEFVNT